MHQQLIIKRAIYDMMLSHLTADYPDEGCGLLAGENGCVSHLYQIENELHSPTLYQMNPTQQLAAMLDAETQGLELLAAYHSHPAGTPEPSATDIAQAYYPELVQVIVSFGEREAPVSRGFLIISGEISEISLKIE